jgi:GTP-binding protein
VAGTLEAARLIVSAASPSQFPPENQGSTPVEIAFLGRSNVGKSSLLNRLVRQPGLAFTSSRPGCTQQINFFAIEDGLSFVDLPGYGYAQAPIEERYKWKRLIENYLEKRRALALSFLLIDARRGWMDMDLELKTWLEFHNRRYQVIVTKVDKLKSNNQLRAGLEDIQRETPDVPLIPVSVVDGRGVREIWQTISKIKIKQ